MIAYAALIDDQADLLRFNELVELYQEDMIRIARSVLYDHQLAEDAVQNALYGIAVSFKKVPSHDAKAVRVYMLSSAKHAALRLKKNEKKIETVGYSEIIDISPEDNPTFEAHRQARSHQPGRQRSVRPARPAHQRSERRHRRQLQRQRSFSFNVNLRMQKEHLLQKVIPKWHKYALILLNLSVS